MTAAPAPRPRSLPAQSAASPARTAHVREQEMVFDGFRYVCRTVRCEGGGGTPVLILGGSSQERFSWVRHERRLLPLSPVVTVDLPGYGGADFLPARYGVDFLAAVVRHLIGELGFPRVNLIGACFGGAIALRCAQHYPQLVTRLMLVGMTTRIPEDYAAAMRRWDAMIADGRTEEIALELAARFMSPPGTGLVRRHAAVSRLVYRQIADQGPEQRRKSAEHNSRLMRHEWYRPEPCPAVPSLVVTGEYDTLTPPEMGREVARVLPAGRFLAVRETDHLAPVERVEDFADLMARFIDDRPLTGLPYASEPELCGGTPRAATAPPAAGPAR